MAKKLLPENVHVRLHTHETAGVSLSCYLAALEAGADGIDLAASPVSGGTSQPDILTLLHATKGTNFDLGGLETSKILEYEDVLKGCLEDYFMPPEATQVSPLIPFSPMPGGALTANTQMMRDNKILHKFPAVIKAMQEVVEKGGYGTSVTPVSQFYFQQAFNNVMFGPWKKIADGYGKMVLGYFGKTPTAPDSEIVELASKQLKLEPTSRSAREIADDDELKSLAHFEKMLKDNDLEINDENIFIAASCDVKGIAFLKGEATVNVRKNSDLPTTSGGVAGANITKGSDDMAGQYTVVVNGTKYNVDVVEGHDGEVTVTNAAPVAAATPAATSAPAASGGKGSVEVHSQTPGNVWKIVANVGDTLKEGDPIMILEAMKMEIDIPAPKDGVLKSIEVNTNDVVADGQLLATMD
jgi:pyruvate carboxylase subunit B